MINKENKKTFRKRCLGRLRHVSKHRPYLKDKIVLAKLYHLIKKESAQEILLYVPLKLEVDISPLIVRLRKEGKNVYVPFMEGESFRVVKYRLPLQQKQFGIKEPHDSKQYRTKKIDIAIVPIIGMDVTRRRVGFGKGMYDRYFEKNSKNINKVVFVTRELCYSKYKITDDYDVKADTLIVP
jgi:5-formyltetrahydrofolate cyclo-ligase